MSQRVTLDLSSFQKLLEAAWVLQCEQDRVANGVLATSDQSPLRRGTSLAMLDTAPIAIEILPTADKSLALEDDRVPPGTTELAPPSAMPLLENVDVVGSLALAPSPESVPQPAPVPFPGSGNAKKPVSGDKGIIGAIHAQRASGFSEGPTRRTGPRLVVVIPKQTPSDLRAFFGPVVVLAVLLVFLFCEIAAHQIRVIPVKAAPEVTPNAARIQPAAPPREHAEAPIRLTSHLRVTDARTNSTLENLSPYEIRNLRRQAQFGDDSAALTLGMAYETGHAVPQNCGEAARWISIAAASGIAAAQYNLALRYQNGDGVTPDFQQANKWMSAAAAHLYPQARATILR